MFEKGSCCSVCVPCRKVPSLTHGGRVTPGGLRSPTRSTVNGAPFCQPHRQRDTGRETQAERHGQVEKETQAKRHGQRDTGKETRAKRHRQVEKETKAQRHSDRDSDREKHKA